jgi:hypothetical protein
MAASMTGLGLFVAPSQSAVMRFAPREQMGTAADLRLHDSRSVKSGVQLARLTA